MWFEHTTFRLGGGRSILLSYRNIFDFSCIFKAFRPSRIRSLARKSSKTSNENRLIRGGCFITLITPSLELSLIFVPQSVRIERPSCFSGFPESFVKNVLRRRPLYPAELRGHKIDHRIYVCFMKLHWSILLQKHIDYNEPVRKSQWMAIIEIERW